MPKTTKKRLIVDSEMHVQEPFDLWLNYIDPKYKDQAPIGTQSHIGDQDLFHDGKVISRLKKQAPHQKDIILHLHQINGRMEQFERFEKENWGPQTQIEAMDLEGVTKAVLYPTRGLFAHAKIYQDDKLAAAISKAYNDWLGEFCAHDPNRLYGAAMVPVQCVEEAVQEIKRARSEYGFKAVFIRPNPVLKRNWHDPVYDPLWKECQKQDMVVGFHEGCPCELPVAVGERFDGVNEDLHMTEHVASHPLELMYACLSMISGKVLQRFPELRVAFLEGNCSWLPFWLWRMDDHYEAQERIIKPEMPMLPSEYFKRQCFASIDASEKVGKYTIDWMGADNLLFSTDYPHADAHYPKSVETFLKQGFNVNDQNKIFWSNPNRCYRL